MPVNKDHSLDAKTVNEKQKCGNLRICFDIQFPE